MRARAELSHYKYMSTFYIGNRYLYQHLFIMLIETERIQQNLRVRMA